MINQYRINLILDIQFGEKILDLAKSSHCWIVESKSNETYIEKAIQESDPSIDFLDAGLSTFPISDSGLQETFNSTLELIMDHHNEYQHTPGINELRVYGHDLCREFQEELESYGFNRFQKEKDGFLATID